MRRKQQSQSPRERGAGAARGVSREAQERRSDTSLAADLENIFLQSVIGFFVGSIPPELPMG